MTGHRLAFALAFAITIVGALCTARVAHAYPQYQLSKDQMCTSCHLAPAGGGLLNENGLAVAEASSTWGTAPEFMYDKLKPPSWLVLGGDLRGAAGYLHAPTNSPVEFPMQAEVYAHATFAGNFSAQVTAGLRDPEFDNEAATLFWSREHYVMWQSNPGGSDGIYVRVGRFMPVFGLRFAEHPDYTRVYGGTQLYGETYGAAMEIVEPTWEAHLTGFIKDPLIDATEHANGAAFYSERRFTPTVSLGLEGMYKITDGDRKYFYGATAKWFLPHPGLLFQAEVQGINQLIFNEGTLEGGHNNELVGYVMASYFLRDSFLIDLGFGHYDADLAVAGTNREAFDLNVHWFPTSHIELMWTNRVELVALDSDYYDTKNNGGYSLLMLHYRL